MVNTLHRCSYANSTFSSVNKVKPIRRFSHFSLSFIFFLSLFFLICFVFPVYVKESFFNLSDTKVNPNCLLFSKRERDRESPKSCREGGRYRLKYCHKGPLNLKQPTNQPNPVMSGMRTPVYLLQSFGQNACQSIDSDLTTHSAILDSISRRFVVV